MNALRVRRVALATVLGSAWLAAAGPDRSLAAENASLPAIRRVGYNMDYPGDWTNAPPFLDQMKNARAVIGSCSRADPDCDPRSHLDLDTHGWLRSLRYRDNPATSYAEAIFILNTSSDRSDIGQRFVVRWNGSGDIDVGNGSGVVREPARRRITFRLEKGDTYLRLRNIDAAQTGDHLRDIEVVRADYEGLLDAGAIFNPELLSWLAPFRSIRFMDWMQSNSYGQCSGGPRSGDACYAGFAEDCGTGVCTMPGQWEQRPRIDQLSYLSSGQYLDTAAPGLGTKVGGYPVEVLVQLANAAGSHPHFNMPAAYTDQYVWQFASFVRDHLASDLVASVEYSNEAWNWGFPQAQYAHTLGQSLWPGLGSAWVQYAGMRTHDMCNIWKQVFAGQEQRVKCLISPQTGWPELAPTMLDCPDVVRSRPEMRSCAANADAVNITGYFAGCLWDSESAILTWLSRGKSSALRCGFRQLTQGGLIPGCEDTLDGAISAYGTFARLAQARGLELVVYEGGTHFSYAGQNPEVRQFLVDLTRDPRMYSAYRRNLLGFWGAGGSTFNAWGWIEPNDGWSNAESLLDFNHPKYRALGNLGSAPRSAGPASSPAPGWLSDCSLD